ncbi:hypothetical protein [Ignatzschineria sp. F8392]|uniref:hypothetical protein n=1 Tax=Ignatzschineria sp. F8392 TaxID=1980117 RepID=UPI001302F82D|nr:hypothetical protein [Ignatzschineria sp. F8392]
MPEITSARFLKSHAGKYRYYNDMILGIINADLRAYSSEKSTIVGSRSSINPLT